MVCLRYHWSAPLSHLPNMNTNVPHPHKEKEAGTEDLPGIGRVLIRQNTSFSATKEILPGELSKYISHLRTLDDRFY